MVYCELLILTEQKLLKNSDIFNGNTPCPLLQRGGKTSGIPILQKGAVVIVEYISLKKQNYCLQ